MVFPPLVVEISIEGCTVFPVGVPSVHFATCYKRTAFYQSELIEYLKGWKLTRTHGGSEQHLGAVF